MRVIQASVFHLMTVYFVSDTLVNRADSAVYLAKHGGRNQVQAYNGGAEELLA